MSDLRRAIRLRRAVWRALDRDDMDTVRATLPIADKAHSELDAEDATLYREWLMSDRVAGAMLESVRPGTVTH